MESWKSRPRNEDLGIESWEWRYELHWEWGMESWTWEWNGYLGIESWTWEWSGDLGMEIWDCGESCTVTRHHNSLSPSLTQLHTGQLQTRQISHEIVIYTCVAFCPIHFDSHSKWCRHITLKSYHPLCAKRQKLPHAENIP